MPPAKYSKILVLEGACLFIIGAGAPAVAALSGSVPMTSRNIVGLVITCLIGGASNIKAFLSTSYSDEKNNLNGNPPPAPEITIDNLR